MSEASYASLGPTLLARKGGAKPAMRPQLAPLPANSTEIAALADEQLEDLGWNDMGGEDGEHGFASPEHDLIVSAYHGPHDGRARGAEVVSITSRSAMPAPANEDSLIADTPIVVRQQKRLALELAAQEAHDDATQPLLRKKAGSHEASQAGTRAPAKGRTGRSLATGSGRRAAFTLRLDADRHMKLRLASTMQNVSAQALVTEALDLLLNEFDDLDALVARLRRD